MKSSLHNQFLLLSLALSVAFSMSLLSTTAFSGEDSQSTHSSQQEAALEDWRLSQQFATINSWDSLDQFIARNGVKSSPFGALSSSGLNAFLDSLEFSEMGVSTINYRVLESELSVSEAYEILKLLGAGSLISQFDGLRVDNALDQRILDSEYSTSHCYCPDDTECDRPATCSANLSTCCVTCNCGVQTP